MNRVERSDNVDSSRRHCVRHRGLEAKNDLFSTLVLVLRKMNRPGSQTGLKKSDRLTAGTTATLRESMTRTEQRMGESSRRLVTGPAFAQCFPRMCVGEGSIGMISNRLASLVYL